MGICEDYRAGATIDFDHDMADKAEGRKIECPLLVLWSGRGPIDDWYDILEVWGEWADDVRGLGPSLRALSPRGGSGGDRRGIDGLLL